MHQPLRTRLPVIEPARAVLQSSLLLRLAGRNVEGLNLNATLGDAPRAVIAFASDSGAVELSPLVAAGTVPGLVADNGEPDAVAAVAALAALEPLVAAIELAFGTALHPVGVGAATLPLCLRVEVRDTDGIVRHAAMLGVAGDFRLSPLPAVAPVFAPRLRARFVFVAIGPSLTAQRIAALAAGDIVLLGGAALPGHLDFGGISRPAHFRPADALISIAEPQGSSLMTEPADAALDPDLRLPLTVEIGGGTATLGELSGLIPGSVVPLGIAGATLPVTLSIGGSAVAHGELVAIGDAYGVLITRRIAD